MNLFPKQTRPYYIVTPGYDHRSSGIRTLHLLCHALNESGQVAQLMGAMPPGQPFYRHPNLNTPVAYSTEFADPIVVYPDTIRGNPLNAKRVVRYFMAERGAYFEDAPIGDKDMVWGGLEGIAENVLRIPCSDLSIFYNDNSPRSGSCFYSLKYDRILKHPLLPITDGMTRLEGNLEQLADILRRSDRCYLYEVTNVMTEAALCGCPVTLIRTPFFNHIDKTCMMGDVEWSDGEVVNRCANYLPEYRNEIRDFWGYGLPNFIERTQKWSNEAI